MLKALPSEASDSTRPCSTSPRGLCSFNDQKERKLASREAEALFSAVPLTQLPVCQGLARLIHP